MAEVDQTICSVNSAAGIYFRPYLVNLLRYRLHVVFGERWKVLDENWHEICILGRTVPSFRMVLEAEIAKWRRFHNALPSKADKEAFEELMNHCRRHAGAAGAAVRPIPLEAMIMSILLAHEKMIFEMKESIQDLANTED